MRKFMPALLLFLIASASVPALADAAEESRLVQQGYAQIVGGKAPEAVKTLSQAVRLNPSNMDARRYLGAAMLQAGLPERAAEQLKVLTQSPKTILTDSNLLGQAYLQMQRYDLAIAAFNKVLKGDLVNDTAHNGLIDCYMASGKEDMARSICSHGVQVARTASARAKFQEKLNNLAAPASPPSNGNGGAPVERPNS